MNTIYELLKEASISETKGLLYSIIMYEFFSLKNNPSKKERKNIREFIIECSTILERLHYYQNTVQEDRRQEN